MVRFRISKSLKAGKIYYIARSSTGSIRKEKLEDLEKAIKDYNQKISEGDIKVESSLEEPDDEGSKAGVSEEVKIEDKPEEDKEAPAPKKSPQKKKRSAKRRSKKSPRKFSGYKGRK